MGLSEKVMEALRSGIFRKVIFSTSAVSLNARSHASWPKLSLIHFIPSMSE
jgi:hypothetical protein